MITKSTPNSMFNSIWEDDEIEHIEFEAAGRSRDGQFRHLVDSDIMEGSEVGDLFATEDPLGRRLIMCKTRYGLVIIFERGAPLGDNTRSKLIYANFPPQCQPLIGPNGGLTAATINRLLGFPNNTIGNQVETICGVVKMTLAESLRKHIEEEAPKEEVPCLPFEFHRDPSKAFDDKDQDESKDSFEKALSKIEYRKIKSTDGEK